MSSAKSALGCESKFEQAKKKSRASIVCTILDGNIETVMYWYLYLKVIIFRPWWRETESFAAPQKLPSPVLSVMPVMSVMYYIQYIVDIVDST